MLNDQIETNPEDLDVVSEVIKFEDGDSFKVWERFYNDIYGDLRSYHAVEYKVGQEFRILPEGKSVMYHVTNSTGGVLPKELSGMYTNPVLGLKAVISYVKNHKTFKTSRVTTARRNTRRKAKESNVDVSGQST